MNIRVGNQRILRPFSAATMMTTSVSVSNLQGGCTALNRSPAVTLFVTNNLLLLTFFCVVFKCKRDTCSAYLSSSWSSC